MGELPYGVSKQPSGWWYRHYGDHLTDARGGPYKTRSEAMKELLERLNFPVEEE